MVRWLCCRNSRKFCTSQIAQLVEQRTENPRVAGSIPALGIFLHRECLCEGNKYPQCKEIGKKVKNEMIRKVRLENMYSFEEIQAVDPEIAKCITDEVERQNSHIELIASENWVSKAVMAAMGSL